VAGNPYRKGADGALGEPNANFTGFISVSMDNRASPSVSQDSTTGEGVLDMTNSIPSKTGGDENLYLNLW
jgi:hypothetical protein